MLADQVAKVRRRAAGSCMSVWTGSSKGTVALEVSFAYWTIGCDTVTIGLQKEWREGKLVLRGLMFEDLAREIFGTRSQRENTRRHWGLEMFCFVVLCMV